MLPTEGSDGCVGKGVGGVVRVDISDCDIRKRPLCDAALAMPRLPHSCALRLVRGERGTAPS